MLIVYIQYIVSNLRRRQEMFQRRIVLIVKPFEGYNHFTSQTELNISSHDTYRQLGYEDFLDNT